MFKKFIQMIIDSENYDDAVQNIFYGQEGIDLSFQRGKITWKEFEMLSALICRLEKAERKGKNNKAE